MEGIDIDVYSDLACPWCYVGKRRLDNAVTEFSNKNPTLPVTVRWHPYIIDARTKPEGEDYMSYNQRRWGGDGWTFSLRKDGEKEGLNFKSWKTWPNTVLAHRLVYLAGQQKGPEGESHAKDVLFRMTYEDGHNISDIHTVIAAAEELGLENGEEFFKSDQGLSEVRTEDMYAKKTLKVSGVPFFVVKDRPQTQKAFGFSGAQKTSAFLEIFDQLISEHE